MQKPLDQNIYKRIKEGDESSFNYLFNKLYSSLCFFSCNYVSDMDKARSLVQQVFVDIWIKREKLNISKCIKSYMYNAVRNKSIDYLRQQKHNIQITEDTEFSSENHFQDLIEEAEINNQINGAINQLPFKCKEIFLLCKFDGLKYKQVAEKLDISIKTVEMQMSIALKKLRESLSDYKSIYLFTLFFSKK